MVSDCLRSTRETVRLDQNFKSCFGGSFCLCCFHVANAVKNGMINGVRKRDLTIPFDVKGGRCGECLFSADLLRKILGKEKPRGLAPIGVIVLLAAIRLLRVLHASNP